jgi:hypothetical protein
MKTQVIMAAALVAGFGASSAYAENGPCGDVVTVQVSPSTFANGTQISGEFFDWGLFFLALDTLQDNRIQDGNFINPSRINFRAPVCEVEILIADRSDNPQTYKLTAYDKLGRQVAQATIRDGGLAPLPLILTVKAPNFFANISYVILTEQPAGTRVLLGVTYKKSSASSIERE